MKIFEELEVETIDGIKLLSLCVRLSQGYSNLHTSDKVGSSIQESQHDEERHQRWSSKGKPPRSLFFEIK
jgi:hypothetical protein